LTYYTFGQPRVGNDAFATVFKSLVNEYRVVHYADIVPHLPPEVLGFHHVPTEV
jgi:predicted lipase